ncbi:MAG: DUF4330 family protein [Vicinamibacterales bacterium]
MIDSKGRLFGRVNAVDALVVVFVLLLVPLAYASYVLFRMPPPVVSAVTPSMLPSSGPRIIHVTGDGFVPYLRAFFGKHDEPLAVAGRNPAATQGAYLLETPVSADIRVPEELPPGDYDLYLFDETRQVAAYPSAFTVPEPSIEDHTYEVLVRFIISPEIVPLLQVGQVDTTVDPATPESAEIVRLEISKEPANQFEMSMARTEPQYFGAFVPATVVRATVRVRAREYNGVLRFQTEPLRAGERFRFQTRDYLIRGTVLRLTRLPEEPS